MLGIALQNSSCEGDEFADRLYVVQSGYDGNHSDLGNFLVASSNHQHSATTFVDCNSKFYSPHFSQIWFVFLLRFSLSTSKRVL